MKSESFLRGAILIALLAAMATASSLCVSRREVPAHALSETELAYMQRVASLSPGHAEIFVAKWPEYADYIMGK